jgi:FMN reductase
VDHPEALRHRRHQELGKDMTVVVVGNPKPNSRTLVVASDIALRLTGEQPRHVVDLIDLGAALLGWGDPKVAEAKKIVNEADSLIVASPTFKGTYSGVLKLFIDQFRAGELNQVTTFPVMVGGSLKHALAPELTLRPVLVEIGASCPAPGLFVLESLIGTNDEDLDAWIEIARRHLAVPGT